MEARQLHPVRAEPELLGQAGCRRRGHPPALRQRRHDGPGAEDRRDRLRPRRRRRPVQRAARPSRASRRSRASPTATRSCRSTPAATRRATAARRRRCPTSAFRDALGYAIDTPAAGRRDARRLRHARASTIIPPFHTRWHVAAGRSPGRFDIDEAKSRLDAAGYTLDAAGKRLDKDGKAINLRLTWPDSEAENWRRTPSSSWSGSASSASASRPRSPRKASCIDDVTGPTRRQRPTTTSYMWGWVGDPDPTSLLNFFRPTRSARRATATTRTPRYDELFLQQRAELDAAKRKAILPEMQELVYAEAPYHILYYDAELHAYRTDKFGGWTQPADRGRHAALRLRAVRVHDADGRRVQPSPSPEPSAPAASGGAARPRQSGRSEPPPAPSSIGQHVAPDRRRDRGSSSIVASACSAMRGRGRSGRGGVSSRAVRGRRADRDGAGRAPPGVGLTLPAGAWVARYLARRLVPAAVTIVLIVLINFVLFRAMPGSPERVLAPQRRT